MVHCNYKEKIDEGEKVIIDYNIEALKLSIPLTSNPVYHL
jgi:hypothetical protein